MLDPYSFFFEVPLYTQIEINKDNISDFFNLMIKVNRVDGYNPILKENTTFTVRRAIVHNGRVSMSWFEGYTEMALVCVRNDFSIKYFMHLECIEGDDDSAEYI